ncbi:hypothetical protein AGLY_011045, partial [Aphis glycines]
LKNEEESYLSSLNHIIKIVLDNPAIDWSLSEFMIIGVLASGFLNSMINSQRQGQQNFGKLIIVIQTQYSLIQYKKNKIYLNKYMAIILAFVNKTSKNVIIYFIKLQCVPKLVTNDHILKENKFKSSFIPVLILNDFHFYELSVNYLNRHNLLIFIHNTVKHSLQNAFLETLLTLKYLYFNHCKPDCQEFNLLCNNIVSFCNLYNSSSIFSVINLRASSSVTLDSFNFDTSPFKSIGSPKLNVTLRPVRK